MEHDFNQWFNHQCELILNSCLGEPSDHYTEYFLKSRISNLVGQLYAQGGYCLDRLDRPIKYENIDIVVNRGKYTIDISIVPKNFDPFG